MPPEPCNLVDTIGSCLRHRRIRAILQQILKPSRHCWTLCFENEKCLDANTYVPSEPCNLVDTKVAYGTVEFVPSANFEAYHRKISFCHESQIW